MFRRKGVRVFAGMLFGSAAGVLWGVWYHTAHGLDLDPRTDSGQDIGLLTAIMVGAVGWVLIGGIVGAARNPVAAMAAMVPAVALATYLNPGWPFLKAESILPSMGVACGLMAVWATAAAIGIPHPKGQQ